MKIFLIIIAIFLLAISALADTTLSRDGEGLKIQGPSFGTIRSSSIGTKGFKCFSTATKVSWDIQAVQTVAGAEVSTISKMFFNGDESEYYPISGRFFQWQNSPTSKTPTITNICLRAYSSATVKTVYGIFQ